MEQLFTFQLKNLDLEPKSQDQASQYYEEFTLDDRKSYRCIVPNCGKIFRFKSEMMRHNVIHFDSRPYKCPHPGCKKTFKRADALDHHVRVHSKVETHECTFDGCGEKFNTKAALKYHSLKHNKERPYHCAYEECGKSFLTLSQLKQHQRAFKLHGAASGAENTSVTPAIEEPEPEPTKIVKTATKKECKFESQFTIPEPKMLKEMEWEIRGQDDDASSFVPKTFENEIRFFYPDQALQTKTLDSPLRNLASPVNFQFDNEDTFQFVSEPSAFFNDNEFKFLDFLREVDANDF